MAVNLHETRWSWRGAGAVALALAGCGSVQDNSPDAAVPTDAWLASCAPSPVVTTVEAADAFYGNDCVHGGWYLQAHNGVTEPATAGPDRVASVVPAPIPLGSNPLDPSSTYAVHVTGSGQQNVPPDFSYAQLTAALNALSEDQEGSVDVRAYTGVQFYAKINTGPTGARFTVGNLYTDPLGGRCSEAGGATGCFDDPGTDLAISTEWTRYQVPFASLLQLGFGNPSPVGAAFPREAITHLRWDLGIPDSGPTPAWELWVDDVTFY